MVIRAWESIVEKPYNIEMIWWHTVIKKYIPPDKLTNFLLKFPIFYSLPFVMYESGLIEKDGLKDLKFQLESTLSLNGNIIECGTWRGGTAIYMAKIIKSRKIKKKIYALDSFEGFNRNELKKEIGKGLAKTTEIAFTTTSEKFVRKKIKILGLNAYVKPQKGYFKKTLPHFREKICFALIDCDLQQSTLYCAQRLWPLIVPGGKLIFDDYISPDDFPGVKFAIDSFIKKHNKEIKNHGLLNRLYFVEKS